MDYLFAKMFRAELEKLGNNIGIIYTHLFSFLTDEELNDNLEYIYAVYKGKDKYFKEHGIENWFGIWHKSVRQTDFFTGIKAFRYVDKLTDEQREELEEIKKELESLQTKRIYRPKKKEWSDTDHEKHKKSYDELYVSEEYTSLIKRLRPLQAIKNTKEDVRFLGKLDSILWNMVHIDNNFLYEVFLRTFSEVDIQEKPPQLNLPWIYWR